MNIKFISKKLFFILVLCIISTIFLIYINYSFLEKANIDKFSEKLLYPNLTKNLSISRPYSLIWIKSFDSAKGTSCESYSIPIYYPNGTWCVNLTIWHGIGKIAIDENHLYIPLDNGSIEVVRKGDWSIKTILPTKPNYIECCKKYFSSSEKFCFPEVGEDCKLSFELPPKIDTDEKYIYISGANNTLYIWDKTNMQLIREIPSLPGAYSNVAGDIVVDERYIYRWHSVVFDKYTIEKVGELEENGKIVGKNTSIEIIIGTAPTCMKVDNEKVYVGYENGTLKIFSKRNWSILASIKLMEKVGDVKSLDIDEQYIYACVGLAPLFILDKDGNIKLMIPEISCTAIAVDNSYIYIGNINRIIILDKKTKEIIQTLSFNGCSPKEYLCAPQLILVDNNYVYAQGTGVVNVYEWKRSQ